MISFRSIHWTLSAAAALRTTITPRPENNNNNKKSTRITTRYPVCAARTTVAVIPLPPSQPRYIVFTPLLFSYSRSPRSLSARKFIDIDISGGGGMRVGHSVGICRRRTKNLGYYYLRGDRGGSRAPRGSAYFSLSRALTRTAVASTHRYIAQVTGWNNNAGNSERERQGGAVQQQPVYTFGRRHPQGRSCRYGQWSATTPTQAQRTRRRHHCRHFNARQR